LLSNSFDKYWDVRLLMIEYVSRRIENNGAKFLEGQKQDIICMYNIGEERE
jgi:hypothetical protein